MRRYIYLLVLLCVTMASFGQHSLQVDDGAGNIGIITGPTSGGMVMFSLPSTPGTLITSGTGPMSAWLLQGNSLTTAGTNFVGTTDNVALHLYVNSGTTNSFILNTNGSIQRLGGNARGVGSVDLQLTRSIATQVASGINSTINGGASNTASGDSSFVGGGLGNIASGDGSFVGGGSYNTAAGKWSLVVGGDSNMATANYATVVGGITDSATGVRSFVGGGTDNLASNQFAVVVGGVANKANGNRSAILGGGTNKANGNYTSILGGRGMQLDGDRSLGFNANDIALVRDMTITSSDVVVFANANL